jgi:hypothetical protein
MNLGNQSDIACPYMDAENARGDRPRCVTKVARTYCPEVTAGVDKLIGSLRIAVLFLPPVILGFLIGIIGTRTSTLSSADGGRLTVRLLTLGFRRNIAVALIDRAGLPSMRKPVCVKNSLLQSLLYRQIRQASTFFFAISEEAV